jgi:hypothetical protein
MSWVQWRDEIWPATEKEAELHLHLWPPDSACPRQSWRWDLQHIPVAFDADGKRRSNRWVAVELMNLNLEVTDWRRLAGREIRADAAWHDLHESTNEHGRLNVSEALLDVTEIDRTLGEGKVKRHDQHCIAHDFIVRLGAWDGFVLPLELDAWMIPRDEYYRLEPKSEEEVARFADGAPNLRVMARTRFKRASVVVERCDDPVPRARKYLREAVGLEARSETAEVSWSRYRESADGNLEPVPGWASVVRFSFSGLNRERLLSI